MVAAKLQTVLNFKVDTLTVEVRKRLINSKHLLRCRLNKLKVYLIENTSLVVVKKFIFVIHKQG